MPSAYFKTEGLVMRKMPAGEANFLVRILTRDFGKMDFLARGARKPASKLNAHLDMLNNIRLQFVKSGERIPTLTDAEIISRLDDWFSDADRLSVAGRILKVIDLVILPGSKDEKLFGMVVDFFSVQGLARTSASGEQPLKNETYALNFLRNFFAHEGHGDSLPEEHREAIIKQWPVLRS